MPLKRGRKSKAEIESTAGSQLAKVTPRPDAPYELTDEQAEVWTTVVNTMPADWYSDECKQLFIQYCRHVETSNRVARMIKEIEDRIDQDMLAASAELDDEDADQQDPHIVLLKSSGLLDKLYKMQDRESKVLASLAVKLRISRSSTTNHRGNRNPSAKRRVWDYDGET